jgi:predicted lipoprotein with Yx(FWY)xxD motif
MKTSRFRRGVMFVTLAAAVGTIGFLAAGALAGSATRTSATVSLRSTKLGMVLVNSKGRTLYLFRKDTSGKSACTASCASYWPPLVTRGTPTGGAGVKASLIGTTKRSDGTRQVTYNKHPLYTYALDTKAGQVNGEGNSKFGAKWYAVSASGAAVVKSVTTTTTTTTGTTTTSPYPYP